jgi:hypothetical protein
MAAGRIASRELQLIPVHRDQLHAARGLGSLPLTVLRVTEHGIQGLGPGQSDHNGSWPAIYTRESAALGRLGLIGYVAAFLGTLMVAGDWWVRDGSPSRGLRQRRPRFSACHRPGR